jgi:hypothetical protein
VRAAADLLGTVGVTVRANYRVAATNVLVSGFLRLAVAGPALAAIHHVATGSHAFRVACRDLLVVGIMGVGAAAVHVMQFAVTPLIGVARTALHDLHRPALHHPHCRPGVAAITAHAHDQTRGRDDRMLRTFIADALSGLIGPGIIAVGARFLLAPRTAAAGYGVIIPPESGRVGAYFGAKGVRDIASGLFVVILLAFRATHPGRDHGGGRHHSDWSCGDRAYPRRVEGDGLGRAWGKRRGDSHHRRTLVGRAGMTPVARQHVDESSAILPWRST